MLNIYIRNVNTPSFLLQFSFLSVYDYIETRPINFRNSSLQSLFPTFGSLNRSVFMARGHLLHFPPPHPAHPISSSVFTITSRLRIEARSCIRGARIIFLIYVCMYMYIFFSSYIQMGFYFQI